MIFDELSLEKLVQKIATSTQHPNEERIIDVIEPLERSLIALDWSTDVSPSTNDSRRNKT